MKMHTTLMASCALAIMGSGVYADCAEELASLTEDGAAGAATQGISKDGSLAPLEQPAESEDSAETDAAPAADPSDTTASDGTLMSSDGESASGETMAATDASGAEASATGDGISKDGTHTPLEGEASGSTEMKAMSGEDAEAQQDGEPTAAEEAQADSGPENPAMSESADAADAASRGPSMKVDADREALMARANHALASGDEEACMAAVEELKAM
ncbi:hypothetical protein MU516_03125 [Paracoccus sp. YLB-12]|uniref:Uncharacterized protein n=1 Tax=Paracoccus maritimus TaxID=2933292 RepID=A0ABT2K7A4_9RHOB|nr:hypothetical protein [Paracoccus sp. YLB-12]MCT4331859.1 hypothetical protein [Paracoccus sp. YLB-12]